MTGPTIDLARVLRAMALNWNVDPGTLTSFDLDRSDLDEAINLRDELGNLGYELVRKDGRS